jgi:hypothetical protein
MSERVSDSGARFATCCGRRASHLPVRGLLLHGLRFHLDLHAVAHEHSARFQRSPIRRSISVRAAKPARERDLTNTAIATHVVRFGTRANTDPPWPRLELQATCHSARRENGAAIQNESSPSQMNDVSGTKT